MDLTNIDVSCPQSVRVITAKLRKIQRAFMRILSSVVLLSVLFGHSLALANDVECVGPTIADFNNDVSNINFTGVLQLEPDRCVATGVQFFDSDISNFATSDAPVIGTSARNGGAIEFLWVKEGGGNVQNVKIVKIDGVGVDIAVDPAPDKYTFATGEFEFSFDHAVSGTRSFTVKVNNGLVKKIESAFTITTKTKVTDVQPATGSVEGGTTVTITGLNLTGTTDVTFGGNAANSFVFVSDTEITAVTPKGTVGTADVRVTSATGFNAANTLFTYESDNGGNALNDTEKQIVNFMHGRALTLLNTKPDLTPFLFGDSNFGGLLGNLDVNANASGFNLAFSSSLGRIWSAQEANEIHSSLNETSDSMKTAVGDKKAELAAQGSAYPLQSTGLSAAQSRGYDMWVQVHATKSSAGSLKSDGWVGHAGAHGFVSDNLLIGAMAQIDWTDQNNASSQAKVQGLGWMAGPYMAMRANDQDLFLDTRVLWGRSSNTISPDGSYEDRFNTERWMANAKLSGVIDQNGWKIQPAIEVSYFEESLLSYTDSQNNAVTSRTISIGEVRFGPTISHELKTEGGVFIRPSVGVSGVWNFTMENEGLTPASGLGSNSLRARFEAGLTIAETDGWAFNVSGFYDGVGVDNYESYGGNVKLVIPLP